jgi:membrane associated rhomboid family serine protease
MYVILTLLGFFGAASQTVGQPLVGASAGIFGVLVAAAVIAPDATVLIYGSIPAKLKTVAYVLLGVAVFTIFSNGFNAGGEAAHLGGAVVGFFLIRRPELLNVFEVGFAKRPRIYRR